MTARAIFLPFRDFEETFRYTFVIHRTKIKSDLLFMAAVRVVKPKNVLRSLLDGTMEASVVVVEGEWGERRSAA